MTTVEWSPWHITHRARRGEATARPREKRAHLLLARSQVECVRVSYRRSPTTLLPNLAWPAWGRQSLAPPSPALQRSWTRSSGGWCVGWCSSAPSSILRWGGGGWCWALSQARRCPGSHASPSRFPLRPPPGPPPQRPCICARHDIQIHARRMQARQAATPAALRGGREGRNLPGCLPALPCACLPCPALLGSTRLFRACAFLSCSLAHSTLTATRQRDAQQQRQPLADRSTDLDGTHGCGTRRARPSAQEKQQQQQQPWWVIALRGNELSRSRDGGGKRRVGRSSSVPRLAAAGVAACSRAMDASATGYSRTNSLAALP